SVEEVGLNGRPGLRVLFLTPRLPYPPLRGDALIALERLRHLGTRHQISLVSFVGSDAEAAEVRHLEPFVHQVRTVTLPRIRGVLNVAAAAALSPDPLQVLYFRSSTFRREVMRAAANVELVHAFFHRTAPYAFAAGPPVVLELMDSLQLRL